MNEKEFKKRFISQLKERTASAHDYQWMRDAAESSWALCQGDPDDISPEDYANDEMSSF